MHDVVIVGVPLIAILAGTLFNNQADIDARRLGTTPSSDRRVASELTANDRNELQSDLTAKRWIACNREFRQQFYRTLGQHDAKIEILEKHR